MLIKFTLGSIFVLLLTIYLHLRKKNKRIKKITMFDWMQMSIKERKAYDKKQRIQTMNRKKDLLDNIRKEYKKVENNYK